ncbi:MAG: protein translocase subunit SecF [Rhodospirillales bacterium]|nr:protein translocase subunit SecF [Rhodospirillales bacterium]
MFKIRLVPDKTAIPFLNLRRGAFTFSALFVVASIALFFVKGLNYGIDFRGGILIEVGTPGPADLGQIRSTLGGLSLGDVAIQEFGAPTDVLIRVERQAGDASAQQIAVDRVKEALGAEIGGDISYRRVEFVGPKVSGELIQAGTLAVVLSVIAMLVYIWFRFEWQFSVGAVIALVHDVALTIGLFSLTGLEFNLSIIAAILTIVGYSMNDTVVVYDRVRENLRKYRRMELAELLNLSINDTLSRTSMTSVTTLLALLSLFFFGGEVIRGFTAAMIWGVVVGTYSSIFIAAPLLLKFRVEREAETASAP